MYKTIKAMKENYSKSGENQLNQLLVLSLYIGILMSIFYVYKHIKEIIEFTTYIPDYPQNTLLTQTTQTSNFTYPIMLCSLGIAIAIFDCIGRFLMLKVNKSGFYIIVISSILDCIIGYLTYATMDVRFNNPLIPDYLYPLVGFILGLSGLMLLMLTTKNNRNAYQVFWNK